MRHDTGPSFRLRRHLQGAATLLAIAGPALAQAPAVQNGTVERRTVTTLAADVAAIGRGATEPVWVGWQAPMVAGARDLCNWFVNTSTTVRGFLADTGPDSRSDRPDITAPTGPVPIEAGTNLLVLARLVDGQIERLRTLTDDCPIDAGGRTIHWLESVTPSASVAYLDTLTRLDDVHQLDRPTANARRSLARAALSALALHGSDDADPILERVAATGPATLQRHAAGRLGADRGARGFAILRRLLDADPDEDQRRGLVAALGATRAPDAAPLLLARARDDASARVRADAVAHYLRIAGEDGVTAVLDIIGTDSDDTVTRRAVSALGSLPDAAGVPHLIDLARTSSNQTVRREAVRRLGSSHDPRAAAYLAELLRDGRRD